MAGITWLIAGPLLLFACRRFVLLFASLLPRPRPTERRDYRISLLIAARNEERTLPRLLAALDRLDYPADLLDVVIISDGSDDATAAIALDWSHGRAGTSVFAPSPSRGKAAALQYGFDHALRHEIVVVLDADTEPVPNAFAILLGALDDPSVGAACGYPDPGIGQRTIVARYAAMERWVTHLVTLAGKDRLGLQPSVIGAFFCVRREALVEAGGFSATSVAEDIDLSQRLTATGWRTRWIGEACASEHVPAALSAFMTQRARWSRGLLATASSVRTIEEAFVAAGYLDRGLLLAAVVATIAGILPWFFLAIYSSAPAAMIAVALWRARAPAKWTFWGAAGAMAPIDLYVSLRSLIWSLHKSGVSWSSR